MKIKDYKCKCGHNDFFFAEKENGIGIYCSYCGKWFKWANKDEKNLAMNCTVKTGKWIEIDFRDGTMYGFHQCSSCGARYNCTFDTPPDWNYCPYCGSYNGGG